MYLFTISLVQTGFVFIPTFIFPVDQPIQFQTIDFFKNIPDSWATATPIPKTGNRHLVNNWRPISIIPFRKIMDKLCTTAGLNIKHCPLARGK